MRKDLFDRIFGGEAVLFAEDVGFAVFDKFIGPADSLDGGVDGGVVEGLDDGESEAVEEDVILEGADDFSVLAVLVDGAGIEGLDPAWVDEGDGVAFFLKGGFGLEGELHHGAERDEADVGSGLEDFCLADGEESGLVLDLRAGTIPARVANGNGAVFVVGHGPEHVDEFVFIFWLHVDEAGDVAEVSDIEEAVVSRAVIAGESSTVHAKADGKVLEGHVMNDHVIGALHEGGVDGEEGAQAFGGVTTGEKGGVFLGDADVEIAFGDLVFKGFELRAAGHGGGDGGDFLVLFGEVGDGAAEEFGEGGSAAFGGAVFDVVGAEAVEFTGFIEGGLIAAALFGDDVENDGFVALLQVLQALDERGKIVSIDGAVVTKAELLEENIRHEHVFGVALDLVNEFTGLGAGDLFDEAGRSFADAIVGGMSLEGVEILSESADVFVDRPFVIVEDDDAALGGGGDVIKSLQGGAAGEGGVTGDGDDVVILALEIATGAHPESGGEGGASVARSVAIVL